MPSTLRFRLPLIASTLSLGLIFSHRLISRECTRLDRGTEGFRESDVAKDHVDVSC